MKTSCRSCKHYGLDIDIYPCSDCEHTMWEPKRPQPAPEPELMTMAQAIAKAVEMGGGEVWAGDKKNVTVKEGNLYLHLALTVGNYHCKSYTVRPLPDPYPLDFAEAWEALGRGESVEGVDNTGIKKWRINPCINASCNGSYTNFLTTTLHDKQFRIVEERKES